MVSKKAINFDLVWEINFYYLLNKLLKLFIIC